MSLQLSNSSLRLCASARALPSRPAKTIAAQAYHKVHSSTSSVKPMPNKGLNRRPNGGRVQNLGVVVRVVFTDRVRHGKTGVAGERAERYARPGRRASRRDAKTQRTRARRPRSSVVTDGSVSAWKAGATRRRSRRGGESDNTSLSSRSLCVSASLRLCVSASLREISSRRLWN